MISKSLAIALIIIALLLALCLLLLAKYYSLSESYAHLLNERRSSANQNKRTKFNLLISALSDIWQNCTLENRDTAQREAFYQTVLDHALELIDAQRGSMMLIDYKKNELIIAAARNISSQAMLNTTIKPGEGIAGRAFKTGEVIFVSEPKDDAGYKGYKGAENENGPFIALPLKIKNKVFGVLNLHLEDKDSIFSDYELKFLDIFANTAAQILANINLSERMDNYYYDMSQMLLRVIGANDHLKRKIAENAGYKAARLAQELELDEKTQLNIKYAAMLCNLGMLGIDSQILNKRAKLSTSEYAELRQHIYLSYQILAPVKYFVTIAKMVLYHKEWYNGAGYPEGLSGENIPLGARIVAVVNAWEAMLTKQPYRAALSYTEAERELQKGSGTQFDPAIVGTFLKLEKSGWPPRF